jgi:hypothetical protein
MNPLFHQLESPVYRSWQISVAITAAPGGWLVPLATCSVSAGALVLALTAAVSSRPWPPEDPEKIKFQPTPVQLGGRPDDEMGGVVLQFIDPALRTIHGSRTRLPPSVVIVPISPEPLKERPKVEIGSQDPPPSGPQVVTEISRAPAMAAPPTVSPPTPRDSTIPAFPNVQPPNR